MSTIINLKVDVLSTFQGIFDDIIAGLPKALGFIGFVLASWIIIKITLYIIRKVLSKTSIDKLSEKLSETEIFGDTTINIVLTKVILGIVKWSLILIFVLAGSSIFGLDTVAEGIKSFIAYLPRLITALAIFVAGIYIGTIVKKAILSMFKSLEVSGGNLVGNIVFYLIVVFLTITALDQAGIDTSAIKSNLSLILGSVLLAFTIAFGLGSRDVIQRLLFGFYTRKNLELGQRIKIGKIEGEIEAIDNITLTIQTNNGKVILPIKDLVDKKVEILK